MAGGHPLDGAPGRLPVEQEFLGQANKSQETSRGAEPRPSHPDPRRVFWDRADPAAESWANHGSGRGRGDPRGSPFAPPRAAGWSPRPQATVTPGARRCPPRGRKWLLPPPRAWGLRRGPVGAGSGASAEGRGPPLATLAGPASGTRGRASLALRPRLRTDPPFSPCARPAGRGGTGRPAVPRGCQEEKQ